MTHFKKKSIRELKNSLGKCPSYKFNFNYFIVKVPTSTYLPLYPGLNYHINSFRLHGPLSPTRLLLLIIIIII